MIYFDNVSKIFENETVGLKNVTLKIEKGEFVFFVGKSGAGKSTLLKLITKEIEPTNGEIFVSNIKLNDISYKEMPYFRRNMGVVNQSLILIDNKTVYDNIALAMIATQQSLKLIKQTVPAVLGMVGLRSKADSFAKELSGGERFRVSLARAIANNPQLLIADEPTANLDSDMSWDIMCLLDEINRLGITILVATHDNELVNIMNKRVVTLNNGNAWEA